MDIGGISTGIDVAGIVEQLMSIERMPLTNYQIKQQIITQKSSIYTDVKTRIETLGTTASELTKESAFDVFSAAYSKESVISASVGASASSGSYKVVINTLAAAHTVGSDRQTDDEAVLSGATYSEASIISATVDNTAVSGSYDIVVTRLATHTISSNVQDDSITPLGLAGTVKINGIGVTIVSGDSLTAIMDKINGTTGIGVTAAIDDFDNTLKITGLTELSFEDDDATQVLTTLGIVADHDHITITNDEAALGLTGAVKINGKDVTIDIADSLHAIMDKINGTTAIGVTATIVNHVLKIAGGTGIAFEDDVDTQVLSSLRVVDPINNDVEDLEQAEFTVDGVLPAKLRDSNVVSDAITGVTLTLAKVDTVTLTVKSLSGNITINGKVVAIDVGDTLHDIMDTINSTEDIGVEATIVDNVLKIKMSETGDEEITFVDNANGALESLGILTGGLVNNEFVAASDSNFTIDGQEISRTSNEISDVITGVTLTLIKEDPDVPVTLTINRNKSAVITKIQNLVSQYNSVVDLIYSKTSEKKVVPPLTDADRYKGLASGDQFLDGIRYEMAALMSGIINGMEEDFDSLAKIGITRSAFVSTSNNKDLMVGKINIDVAKLTTAMDEDFENVKEMFISNANTEDLESEDYGIAVRVKNYVDSLTNIDGGYFATKSAGFTSETTILTSTIENFNRRMVIREAMFKAKYVRLDVAMAQSDTQSQWLTAQLGSL